MKLTVKQREVLQSGAAGICIQGVWIWVLNRQRVTRIVKTLVKKGLGDTMAFSGGRGAFNANEKGREFLQKE